MELWLTDGMFGEKKEKIADAESPKEVLERVFMWKNDDSNRIRYKIERYDRMIFEKDSIAIDFGDYSHFLMVTGVTPEGKGAFMGK